MREIKFRAKSKGNTKKWVYGTGIVPVKNNTYDTDEYEMIQEVNYDELDYYIPDYEAEDIDINTIGQYTGLKDKNGVEIYEGDILEDLYSDDRATVEWSEEDGMFVLIIDDVQTNFSNEKSTGWEVMGNIYDI